MDCAVYESVAYLMQLDTKNKLRLDLIDACYYLASTHSPMVLSTSAGSLHQPV